MAKQQHHNGEGYKNLDELREHLKVDGVGVEKAEEVVQSVVNVVTGMPDFACGPINEDYCWMHKPGGWTCVACVPSGGKQ